MDVKQNLILTSRVIPMVSVFPLMTDEDMVVEYPLSLNEDGEVRYLDTTIPNSYSALLLFLVIYCSCSLISGEELNLCK